MPTQTANPSPSRSVPTSIDSSWIQLSANVEIALQVVAVDALTVSMAALLFALPDAFVATTRNRFPLSSELVAGVVWLAVVAPEMFVQFPPASLDTCHCSAGAGTPLAVTLNVAVDPTVTVTSCGCETKAGASAGCGAMLSP
jgi:hypothetical protein